MVIRLAVLNASEADFNKSMGFLEDQLEHGGEQPICSNVEFFPDLKAAAEAVELEIDGNFAVVILYSPRDAAIDQEMKGEQHDAVKRILDKIALHTRRPLFILSSNWSDLEEIVRKHDCPVQTGAVIPAIRKHCAAIRAKTQAYGDPPAIDSGVH